MLNRSINESHHEEEIEDTVHFAKKPTDPAQVEPSAPESNLKRKFVF